MALIEALAKYVPGAAPHAAPHAAYTLITSHFVNIFIPICGLVGIAFALLQWHIVSKIKVSPEAGRYNEYVAVEDGTDDQGVIHKVAEIQEAISKGELSDLQFYPFSAWRLLVG